MVQLVALLVDQNVLEWVVQLFSACVVAAA